MKPLFFFSSVLLVFGVACFSSSCMSKKLEQAEPEICDTLTNVTYNGLVKPIMDESCAYSGCHDGANGIGPGDYNNYNGLEPFLIDGSFEDRVILQKDDEVLGMPPDVYIETQKADLTQEELDIIQCWINAGYPEN